ncbi:MAG: hypothetical protein QOE41_1416 [Mycobacterium sp.]|jgi:hypothetical protein|nr:hypothetical protein [Mycobacterium sp.]MDT5132105.1 hypothetical protein [Mycobacterium sp.]
MRNKLIYMTPLLAAGAAAVTIAAAPAAIAAAAPSPRAGVDTLPLAGPDHGGAYCGDFCGSYSLYGNDHGVTAVPASPWGQPSEPKVARVPSSTMTLPVVAASGIPTAQR